MSSTFPDKAAATPVMRQYLTAKESHRDALLFFRMGDFYELFYDDAVVAARALDLTLTSRNRGGADEIPMAGVPHHAASSYIQRLIEQGFKVAICEQMADPATVKGIVPREVVRVVSPGIVFDETGLDARQNHFLVAIERDGAAFGIGALDLSTGELVVCEAADGVAALSELVRLDPREVLVGPDASEIAAQLLSARPGAVVRDDSARVIDDNLAVKSLDLLLGEGEARASCRSPVARRAAARCVAMAMACEPGRALPVARLSTYTLGDLLLLDDSAQRHLELVRTMTGETIGSLLEAIDMTVTSPGARLLRRQLLSPLTNVAAIRRRLDAVECFVSDPPMREQLRLQFARISDIERLAVKLSMRRAAPRDLTSLRGSLGELPHICATLDRSPDKSLRDALGAEGDSWIDLCAELHELLARSIADDPPVKASDGYVIRDGFDAQLDESRAMTKDGQRYIVELEARLREQAQIPSLKVKFTRVFGWYLEVTRTHLDKAPAPWRRKQTIATGERFTCDELDELADKLAHAEDRCSAREALLLSEVIDHAASFSERLRAVSARLAQWDVWAALAQLAHRDDWVRPTVDDSLTIDIEDGRHPVVERALGSGRFVPNDVRIDGEKHGRGDGSHKRLWLITGPNMAGKSTLMRQTALAIVLAQMGSFVPARRARIGVVDRVLTRVGASDNLARGESTFMTEMKETAHVLRSATRRSLVVIDEIGRGTSTYDGLAIAWAVAEHLHDAVGCRAMFATHYHELTALSATHTGCENWSVSAREHEGDIVFLHKLQRGAASRSYGVACARLAGLPEMVLARARVMLVDLEKGRGIADMKRPAPQLELFVPPVRDSAASSVAETLRGLNVDRMTPIEALQVVASLKALLG